MDVQRTVPAAQPVVQALKAASERTGTSFDYLVSTAYRESTFRPDLKATTSTATGLFQFLEQPWLEMVKQEGPALGLGRAAEAITRDGSGRYAVADPAMKQAILDLRNDPAVSSVMAGIVTQRNAASLERAIGRQPTQQDLYVAHVLGPTGGARMIQLAEKAPATVVAPLYPAAAAANVPIFYNKDGSPRTAQEVYGFLAKSHAAEPLPAGGAGGPRTSPAAVADLLRAQVGAKAADAGYGIGGGSATDMRASRVVLGQTSLPGDASGTAAPTGGKLEGWRAGAPKSAFAALMRTDTAPAAGPGFQLGQALGYADPGTTATGVGAATGAVAAAGGAGMGAGPAAIQRALATGALPTGRPSRMVMTALANGAPEAPLPMTAVAAGAPRPSRFSMASLLEKPGVTAATAAGVVTGVGATAASVAATAATTGAVPVTTRAIRLEPLSILPPVPAGSAPMAAGDPVSAARVAAAGFVPAAPVAPPAAPTATPATPDPKKPRPLAVGKPLDLTRMMPLR